MRTVVFRQGFRVVRAEHHEGETILQTARRANVFINTNCVQGKCGTCACNLRRGRATSPETLDAIERVLKTAAEAGDAAARG